MDFRNGDLRSVKVVIRGDNGDFSDRIIVMLNLGGWRTTNSVFPKVKDLSVVCRLDLGKK